MSHPDLPPPPGDHRPRVIGLIGGVASGKSTVAKFISQRNGYVLDADRVGHDVLEQSDVLDAIEAAFGKQVTDADGSINRQRLGTLVFASGDDQNKKRLESIVHPVIRRRVEEQLKSLLHENRYDSIVIDAPLLIEAGWQDLCDTVWFIDTPLDQRQQSTEGRGWTTDEISRREKHQLSLAEKMLAADEIVENSSTLEALEGRIAALLRDAH